MTNVSLTDSSTNQMHGADFGPQACSRPVQARVSWRALKEFPLLHFAEAMKASCLQGGQGVQDLINGRNVGFKPFCKGG